MKPWRVALAILALGSGNAYAESLLFFNEGNRMHRADPEGGASQVFIPSALDEPQRGRDVNGMICAFPDGSGRIVTGEDTHQPHTPPGWGIFQNDGLQVGKLTATYRVDLGDPFGCAFDAEGRLFTTEIGNVGFGPARGQLILWFPPYDGFPGPDGDYPNTGEPSDNFCKIATDIGTAGGIAVDSEGRVYVASSSRGRILRFSPPFPSGPDAAAGCGTAATRETFASGLFSYSGLAIAPNGNLYAASVFTGEIIEYDLNGDSVRQVLAPTGWLPPFPSGTPQGIAVGPDGTLYYADLDLRWHFIGIDAGPNGKIRRIRFDATGQPLPPETLFDGLAFPDGVAVLPSDPSIPAREY